MKFLRRKEIEKLTGLGRSSIYHKMSQGIFPKNFKLGLRAVAWLESDIEDWMKLSLA